MSDRRDRLWRRIRAGRTDLVIDLVAEGESPSATDASHVSLLQWCAYYGDVSALRFLVEKGASLTALGDNLDLNGAAFHGHWRLVQYLVEKGAKVNHPLPDTGETPLHAAVGRDLPQFRNIVRILLAHGADPNRATHPGVETGSFMRDVRTRGETPLHRAAAFAGEEVIELLVGAGARLDARDANGDSPLTWASWHGRPAYILARLSFGEHTLHPAAVERSRRPEAPRWSPMDEHLQGEPDDGTGSVE